MVKKGGGEVKGAARYPFPDTTDFSSYLTQAQASGATVVGFANAGLDTENCIKQAAEFGLNNTMKLAPLLMFIQNPHSLGTKICGGLLTTETFYWDMNDRTRALHQAAAGADQGRTTIPIRRMPVPMARRSIT